MDSRSIIYIAHQLAHMMDTGITNAAIYYFEANPHLTKKDGTHRSFVEDNTEHLMDAKYIDWEGMCHVWLLVY
jgi:hypothetical protein